jgi:hypothetical protein
MASHALRDGSNITEGEKAGWRSAIGAAAEGDTGTITTSKAVANQAARLALTTVNAEGFAVIDSDTGKTWMLKPEADRVGTSGAWNSADWLQLGDRDITAADITDATDGGKALLTGAAATANIAVNTAIAEDPGATRTAADAEKDLTGATASLEGLPKQTSRIFFDNGDGERHAMTYAEFLADIEAQNATTPTVFYDGPTDNTKVGLLQSPNPALVNVFVPTTQDVKTYNFHPSLYQTADGRVHLQHTQHGRNEEGKGSYTTYWFSDDNGATWTDGGVLMPSMETYDVTGIYGGPRPLPGGWCVVDGQLYAIADSVEGVGLLRTGVGLFAIPVTGGAAGTPILLYPSTWVAETGFPQYAHDADLFKKVFAALNHPYGSSWPDGLDGLYDRMIPATNDLGQSGYGLEFSKVPLATGWMLYARAYDFDTYPSTHLAAYSPNGFEFRPMVETNLMLPYTRTCVRKMSDRYIFFANESPSRARLFFGYSADGVTWNKRDCYILRGTNATSPTWAGEGKTGGATYVDCIELLNGDYLAAYGERGKEIISVSRWTPESLKGAGNLITHPNDFPNAYWVKTRATITWYATDAPDGHPGAALLTNTAVTGTKLLSTGTAAAFSGNHTMSIYVKQTADGSFPYLRIIEATGIAFATFDTTGAGAVGNSGGTAFVAAGIDAAANGWYRIWMTVDYGSNYRWGVGISLTNNAAEAPSISSATPCSLYVWGARMEPGTVANPL